MAHSYLSSPDDSIYIKFLLFSHLCQLEVPRLRLHWYLMEIVSRYESSHLFCTSVHQSTAEMRYLCFLSGQSITMWSPLHTRQTCLHQHRFPGRQLHLPMFQDRQGWSLTISSIIFGLPLHFFLTRPPCVAWVLPWLWPCPRPPLPL